MRAGVRDALDAALSRSPAQPIFRWRAAHRLRVLAYHGVDEPERFRDHMAYLARSMHPVALEQVVGAATGRNGLPDQAVLVTFDDGHRSVLEHALPIMAARGIPGVVFVIAGLLDTEEPFWWTEVADLAAAGGTVTGLASTEPRDVVRALKRVPNERRLAAIDELRRTAPRPARRMRQLRREELHSLEAGGVAVGNHSLTHPCLSRCARATVSAEVGRSHALLTDALGHEPQAFAYPDGDGGGAAVSAVAEAGYRMAFRFDHRVSHRPSHDPLSVSRLRVDSDTGPDRFRTIVSGLHPALHRARGGE